MSKQASRSTARSAKKGQPPLHGTLHPPPPPPAPSNNPLHTPPPSSSNKPLPTNTPPPAPAPAQLPVEEKSTVKTYRPPDGSPPVLCIHTTPALMKRLSQFLSHFDRPPQQLFLEFVFVEVNEDDVAQFRYKLNHPLLDSIYGQGADDHVRTSPLDDDVEQGVGALGGIAQGRTRRVRRLPESLTPRI